MALGKGIMPILLFLLYKISNSKARNYGENVNSGSLLLKEDSTLTIDTSTPSAVSTGVQATSYNMSLSHHNFTGPNGIIWNYSVAHLDIYGNITLASRVIITGRHALSLRSISGNIVVKTTLSMTCATTNIFNGTCLGGFLPQNSLKIAKKEGVYLLYNANGPGRVGASNINFFQHCLPGAGHGGKGGMDPFSDSAPYNGWHYGRDDRSLLLGGTSGLFHHKYKERGHAGAGGGAIELIATNGSITIEGEVLANAQKGSEGSERSKEKYFAGSSGGLIRLKATEVNIRAKGKLQAAGSDSTTEGFNHNPRRPMNGGGGIIQILAPKGKISEESKILLQRGDAHATSCTDSFPAEDGYLEIGGFYNRTTGELSENKNNGLCWNETQKITCPTMPLSSMVPQSSPAIVSSSINPSSSQANLTFPSSTLTVDSSSINPVLSQAKSLSPTSSAVTVSLTIKMKLEMLFAEIQEIKNTSTNATELEAILLELQHILNGGSLGKDSIEVLVVVFRELGKVFRNFMKQNVTLKQEVLTKLLSIADQSMAEKNSKGWQEYQKVMNFIGTLEGITLPFSEWASSASYGDIDHYTHNIAVEVTTTKTKRSGNYELPIHGNSHSSWKDSTDKIVIPHDFIASSEGNITFVVILNKVHKSWTPFLLGSTQSTGLEYELNSSVFSCMALLGGKRVTKLDRPAKLYFKHQASNGDNPLCVFWNETPSHWSTEGVTTTGSSTSQNTTCSTSHLTSFAVLMQFTPIEFTREEKLSLSMITYIGCVLSIVCLIVTLIVFLFVDSLSNERHKIHMNLAIAVLLTQVLFVFSNRASQMEILCRIMAVFQHYFASTVFTWMCIEGIHLYIKIVNVFGTEGIKMKYYYSFGWGLPVLWVGIAAIVKPEGYGNFRDVCWLTLENKFIWIFLGPVVAIIVMNIIVMIMVVKIVVTSASANKSSSFAHVKAGIKGVFVLLPILGLSWGFGLLMVGKTAKIFAYLFTTVNSFQGVFIFLLYCLGNTEIRASFRRMREKRALTKSEEYNASFSASKNDSQSGKGSDTNKSLGLGKIKNKFTKHHTKAQVIHIKPKKQDSRKTSFHINRTVEQTLSPPITPSYRDHMSLHTPEDEIEEIVLPDNAKTPNIQQKNIYSKTSRRLRKA